MKPNYSLILILSLFYLAYSPAQTSLSGMGESTVPSIDGKISEKEWAGATVFTNFYIVVPKTEEKYYDSTIVYVRQSKDAIYFAFKWWPRGKIISKSFTRDQTTDEESEFFIMLDLENKHQNGYFFAFSFLNNQRDGLVYKQNNISFEWDWVWECKTTIFKEAKDGVPGYVESEIKIPVDKLQNKNPEQIAFDLQLFAYKPDGTLYTYSIIPNSELMNLKNGYEFNLKQPFDEKLNLKFDIIPYVVANRFNDKNIGATLGGDVNVSFEKHKLKGTINTDQSTIEADPFTFTLYNRPVFLTEKRPFFSKDFDIYYTPVNLFYTRSIDSITYGVNYTYRSDMLKAGFVYVNEPMDNTSKSFMIARPNFNFPDFNFGGLFIYTNDKSISSIERIVSFDGVYRVPNTRLRFGSQFAGSFNGKSGLTYYLSSTYLTNYAGGPSYQVYYNHADKNFRSSTSFNSQIGTPNDFDELYVQPAYTWKFNRKYFGELTAVAAYYKLRQLSSNFIYQEKISSQFYYKLNDIISLNHYFEFNHPNDYDENGQLIKRNNIDLDNNVKFLLGKSALNIGFETGPYFGSYLKHPYANVDLVLFDRMYWRFSYNYLNVFDIKQSIFGAKLDWSVIPKLFVRSYFQQDTYNKLAMWNTMLQYEFFAGSSVYLVMNLQGDRLQSTGRYFKVGYDFSF